MPAGAGVAVLRGVPPARHRRGLGPSSRFPAERSQRSNWVPAHSHVAIEPPAEGVIVPIAAVMVAFVDFLISLAILGGADDLVSVRAGLAGFAVAGVCSDCVYGEPRDRVWITALNVKYRDFRYVIPFIVQLGLYVSPVGFSSSIIPAQWRLLYSLNPLVGVIDGFRWCLLGGESRLYLPGLGLSFGVTAFFLWLGIRQFRKMEKSFADLI